MTILFSTTYYHPYVSGLSLYIRRLVQALPKKTYAIHVLCMCHSKKLPKKAVVDGVSVYRAQPFMALHKGFLSLDFMIQAWRMAKLADVIVINLPQFEGWWPALFGRLFGKKVIAIYHSEIALPDGFFNRVVQLSVEIANTVTLLLADIVVTYTQDFAENSRLLRLFRAPKLHMVYPPIPKPVVRAAIVARLKKKIGNADIVIGVAARLAAEKGIEYLLEAIPILVPSVKGKKLKVIVAGPMDPVGERAYKEKIMRLVETYKEYIVFLGEIPPEDMGAFYASLDVLVLPSVNNTETFGMVQVEAMMTGVPVVASDLPGVRVPIRQTGMGIVVPPRDAPAIAQAIEKILAHKETYTKERSVIMKEFSLKKTVGFYERLIVRVF